MKIALCQINPIVGDFDHNTSLIMEWSERAANQGCSLAVFPELSLVGYPPKDLLERPSFIRENLRRVDMLAEQIKSISVLFGYVDMNPNFTGKPLLNCVALIRNGKIAGKGGKRLLPAYDVFDETRYFEPAPEGLVFELDGQRLGVTICEDIWNVGDFEGVQRYDIDPVSDLMTKGVEILVNLSASPYTLHKRSVRKGIMEKLATRYGVPTIYCNQVGGNDDVLFDGASMVVDPRGRLILMGREFEEDLLVWDSRQEYPPLHDPIRPDEESILKGLVMGTRDYLRKCGFRKAIVGLSGGIDSSLVAVVAQRALGAGNVMGVSMPSPYTSPMSREDAAKLAENLGIGFQEIPITEIYDTFRGALAPVFAGLKEDETEENIQARVRGTLLMALSNKFNAILLSTGNKSEIAVGYCTIYGDMNGGLAVISDIPKTMCYKVARYINRDQEIIPARVISRPPSAELRPDQKDQDTLPPYEILDGIIDAAVVRNLGFQEIVDLGYDPATVKDVLKRITVNEYKRRQAPPGLKITTKAFGYGRRYPIARGKEPY
ncbi:MAG: NAD+ synthase [Deltaproteobacteria bacterium HGW-Deltaproteobacteria-15]|nr:MAG: NAD+ synthase [Deltaproteobacteria bacterium HGW-Deltaproteobacteria-15]